jgi:hypothetical protein
MAKNLGAGKKQKHVTTTIFMGYAFQTKLGLDEGIQHVGVFFWILHKTPNKISGVLFRKAANPQGPHLRPLGAVPHQNDHPMKHDNIFS